MESEFNKWYNTEGIRYYSKDHGSAAGHKDYMNHAWEGAMKFLNHKSKCPHCGNLKDAVKDKLMHGGGYICSRCYKEYES